LRAGAALRSTPTLTSSTAVPSCGVCAAAVATSVGAVSEPLARTAAAPPTAAPRVSSVWLARAKTPAVARSSECAVTTCASASALSAGAPLPPDEPALCTTTRPLRVPLLPFAPPPTKTTLPPCGTPSDTALALWLRPLWPESSSAEPLGASHALPVSSHIARVLPALRTVTEYSPTLALPAVSANRTCVVVGAACATTLMVVVWVPKVQTSPGQTPAAVAVARMLEMRASVPPGVTACVKVKPPSELSSTEATVARKRQCITTPSTWRPTPRLSV
jgi:hypothetical protein